MRLTEFLRPDRILPELHASGRDEVFEALGALAASLEPTADREEVIRQLTAREEEHTTVLGYGIAIPHAMIPELATPLLLLGISPEPIRFGPEASAEADVFFVLLSPPGGQTRHIKMLARICRIARDPAFTAALRSGGDAPAVFEAIRTVDERHV
jgi:mannitol/fructose-specific phosphotransferase system IIA component (Ntr-type)